MKTRGDGLISLTSCGRLKQNDAVIMRFLYHRRPLAATRAMLWRLFSWRALSPFAHRFSERSLPIESFSLMI
jgi:hypothetical protein